PVKRQARPSRRSPVGLIRWHAATRAPDRLVGSRDSSSRGRDAIVVHTTTCIPPEAMTPRFRNVFGAVKPIIAMVHCGALPGTPLYDPARGLDGLVEDATKDLKAL